MNVGWSQLGLIALASICPQGAAFAQSRYPTRPDIPAWWQQTRSFYCPLANSGAGGSLMKYNSDKRDNFTGFQDLPNMLEDARRLGSNCVYLVDYWDPDYPHKSDYHPKEAWGGPAGLAQGVTALHALGGRIILYLEAWIIHRDTSLGRISGMDWGMMQIDPRITACDPRLPPPGCWGPYPPPYHDAPYFYWYPYADTHYEYYLMWPGSGSGWADYLVALAGQMARDYHIDGVHLDSYGVHRLLADQHPDHPGGTNIGNFQAAGVQLITRLRARMRTYVPDAVVILEGASYEDFLAACDGSQFESWTKLCSDIPYACTTPHEYPIFTSSSELDDISVALLESQALLNAGHNLALPPWWFDQGQAAVQAVHEMCVEATGDGDFDEACGSNDNCPASFNPDQADSDSDGVGDACDFCPGTPPHAPIDETGCPLAVPADFDLDGDVDQADFGRFQACLTGDGQPQDQLECRAARLDVDDDVDVHDFDLFTACFSGPDIPADPNCVN